MCLQTWPCSRPQIQSANVNANSCFLNVAVFQAARDETAKLLSMSANAGQLPHSSSGDTMFVGVHGSPYNSPPSPGGAGPLGRHLEAAISRMHSSRQLPPETSRTARPPPTVRRQDRELGLPRLHMARHQNPRVGRGSPELWTSRGSHLVPSSRQLRSEIENGPTHPHTVRRHDLVVDDDEVVKNKVDDPVLPAKCAGA